MGGLMPYYRQRIWELIRIIYAVFMKLRRRIEACLIVLLIFIVQFLIIEKAYADSTVSVNSSMVSMHITGMLSNGIFVETNLENRIPINFSTNLSRECLNFSTQGSTLLIICDARIPEAILVQATSVEETGRAFDGEWFKHLELLIVFATGLVFLALETFSSKIHSQDVLKMIERGETPPKGSVVGEESLLLLSSKNPEAYRRAVDMVLKGELKIKKKRLRNLRKAFSKVMKFVNFRRRFLF